MQEAPGPSATVTLRLLEKEDAEQICNMLRGLLLSSKTVELKGITNSRLLRGHSIPFGDAAPRRNSSGTSRRCSAARCATGLRSMCRTDAG